MTQAIENTEAKSETKRDRVRRLLIDPMARDGMRFEHGTPDEVQRKRLDRMADDLSHMSDVNLGRLLICLRTKGDGSAKHFWPSRITILGYAQVAQPRPLEDEPGLKAWFVSEAGRKASQEPGRLVAEFEFWTKHHHPPFGPAHKRLVSTRASEFAGRVERIADRETRGATLGADDAAWIGHYRQTHDRLMGWLSDAAE